MSKRMKYSGMNKLLTKSYREEWIRKLEPKDIEIKIETEHYYCGGELCEEDLQIFIKTPTDNYFVDRYYEKFPKNKIKFQDWINQMVPPKQQQAINKFNETKDINILKPYEKLYKQIKHVLKKKYTKNPLTEKGKEEVAKLIIKFQKLKKILERYQNIFNNTIIEIYPKVKAIDAYFAGCKTSKEYLEGVKKELNYYINSLTDRLKK